MRAAALLLLTPALAMAMAACGDTSSRPAWAAGHPDTALTSLQATAPGVCAITVRYPDVAPAGIVYLGAQYVQVGRQAHMGDPPGHQVDHTGDWQIYSQAGGDLLLETPTDTFQYRAELSC